MIEHFLDDFCSSIREDVNKAVQDIDADNGISSIMGSITDFFANNVYALIFALNIYDRNLDNRIISERLKSHGIDMTALQLVINKKYSDGGMLIRLFLTTFVFYMSIFHMEKKSIINSPSCEDIKNINSVISKIVKQGIGYSVKENTINFEKLEKQVDGIALNAETGQLFKAVAEAVAEAGPWNVSMDMVAKKMGFCKSSLYGHFKNRKDMLRRLFETEFKRIIEFARQGISLSSDASEQLYLGIFSISLYLRLRPEILVAIDWIRTRNLDLGKPEKKVEIFRLFEDVDFEPMKEACEEEKMRISHWILFLLTNILMQPVSSEHNLEYGGQNNNIRLLYKFIISGLGGFKR